MTTPGGAPSLHRDAWVCVFCDEAPGSGKEVWFAEYEVFAVMVGLVLMLHHWPHKIVVKRLRRRRQDLEREHARTLSQDTNWLFDPAVFQQEAGAGQMVLGNRDPVLLTMISIPALAIAEEDMPFEFGGAWSFYEIVEAAHKVRAALALTHPRARGRS